MTRIAKNHFALHRTDYIRGLVEGRYAGVWPDNLSIHRIDATPQNFHPLQDRVSERWQWSNQPRYVDGAFNERLADKETALFELRDREQVIGYALVTSPPPSLKTRFWGAANQSVIEIENLGLFPGQEGGGR